ncbi:MAG: FG-GAP-like repeat-containing protein [Chitinophagales bacterium]
MKKILLFLICSLAIHSIFGQTLFNNVAEEQGVLILHNVPAGEANFGTGAVWFDYDNDGDIDLYVTNNDDRNHLFRNNRIGLGTADFTDVTTGDALCLQCKGSGVSAADYDNDGDKDLYLANLNQDILLRNDGNEHFTNATFEAFGADEDFQLGFGSSASWGDVNNDGWLDLYVSNHIISFESPITPKDFLYINNGGNPVTFTDRSDLLAGDTDADGTDDLMGFGFIGIFTDFDNNGTMDIYLANDCPLGPEDNKLFKNNGNMTFSEVSTEIGPFKRGKVSGQYDCHSAMGLSRGDMNHDGYLDYHFSNIHYHGINSVLLQNTGKNLLNVSEEAGLDKDIFEPESGLLFTWGTIMMDYDLDTWQDIYLASGSLRLVYQPNFLYHSGGSSIAGTPVFTQVADEISGTADARQTRTIVKADYDMDGDPDVYLVNFDTNSSLLQNNNATGYNWAIIDVVGAGPPLSNKDGIGAKITLTTPDQLQQYDEIYSGSSLGGGDDMAAYFGLKEHTTFQVSIKWPSGIVKYYGSFEANQRLKLYEPTCYVFSPKEGAFLQQEETQIIQWKSVFEENEEVKIILLSEGIEDRIIVNQTLNDGVFEWEIPNDLEAGQTYSVKIEGIHKASFEGVTNGYFSILPPSKSYVQVLSPNGGELLVNEPIVSITWNVLNNSVNDAVAIYLYNGNNLEYTIAENTPNDGQYEWEILTNMEGNAFRIKIVEQSTLAVYDWSDKSFVISYEKKGNTSPLPDPSSKDIVFWPIPTNDVLYCRLNNELVSIESLNIEIFNTYGSKIYGYELSKSSLEQNTWKLDLPALSTGIYFCILTFPDRLTNVHKILITK